MALTKEEALEMVKSDFGWYSLAKCVNDLVLVQCQLTKPELGCLNVAKTRYHKTLLVQVEAAQKALLDHRDIYLQAYDTSDDGMQQFKADYKSMLDADTRHALIENWEKAN